MSDQAKVLALWLAEQQQASRLAQQQTPRGELHLHQHHHAAPAPSPVAEPEQEYRTVRMHPLYVAAYMLFLSVAISLPIALIAAIVEAGDRPNVQYVQPSRGGW